jgi:hypothetical protein
MKYYTIELIAGNSQASNMTDSHSAHLMIQYGCLELIGHGVEK